MRSNKMIKSHARRMNQRASIRGSVFIGQSPCKSLSSTADEQKMPEGGTADRRRQVQVAATGRARGDGRGRCVPKEALFGASLVSWSVDRSKLEPRRCVIAFGRMSSRQRAVKQSVKRLQRSSVVFSDGKTSMVSGMRYCRRFNSQLHPAWRRV